MNPFQPPESGITPSTGRWPVALFAGLAAGIFSWVTMLLASEPGKTLPPTTVLPPGQVIAEVTNVYLTYVWASYGFAAIAVYLLFVSLMRQPASRIHRIPWVLFIVLAILASVVPSAIYVVRGLPISF